MTAQPDVSLIDSAEAAFGALNMDMLLGIGLFICAILSALILHAIIYFFLQKATSGEANSLFGRVVRRTRTLARLVLVIAAIELTLPLISLPGEWVEIINRIVTLVLIGLTGWLVVQTVQALTDARMSRYDITAEDNLEARKVATRMKVLRQGMTMIILLVTVGAMLMTFPSVRAIGVSLFASAGVAGIVIGFAARPVLSNLLAGIQIALTQPIRIGDAVIMENEWGWIEEITSTYVVVKIWDWRRLVVPLTQIIEKPFQNWTRETASIIGSVTWHLDYTAPVAEMRVKLKEFLDESTLWDKDVQVLQLIDTSEETIEIRALMSAKNSPVAFDLRCEIREKMVTWLQENHPGSLPRRRGQLQIDPTGDQLRPAASAAVQSAPAPEDEATGLSEQIGHPDDESHLMTGAEDVPLKASD